MHVILQNTSEAMRGPSHTGVVSAAEALYARETMPGTTGWGENFILQFKLWLINYLTARLKKESVHFYIVSHNVWLWTHSLLEWMIQLKKTLIHITEYKLPKIKFRFTENEETDLKIECWSNGANEQLGSSSSSLDFGGI